MLISKSDRRSVLQTPSFCFSVKSPSLKFKYPTTKDTFHLQREGQEPLGSAWSFLQKLGPDSPFVKEEMEKHIRKALQEEPNLELSERVLAAWVDFGLDTLGLLDAQDTEVDRQGLEGVAKEVYKALTSSKLGLLETA
ncbi:MAG: hypothetical protein ACK551_05250 [Vampirovibrionales bacterium]